MIRLKPVAEQIIVITGASSGIGRATAIAAIEAGARVVVSARNAEALEDVAGCAGSRRSRVATIAVDIADEDAAERIAAAADSAFGGFDTWVNNAAAASIGRLTDTSVEDQRRAFDVGYWGLVRGSLAAVKVLRTRGGSLINVGSIESDRAVILQGTYSAMKLAVKGFTDALRMEVEADRLPISVTLVKPAAMHTPFPEHARNLTGHPITLPPMIYDPRLSARAILFAAAHPRRDISIGGTGVLGSKLAQLAPRLTDRMLEAFGEALQTTDQPPPATRVDNLWQPRENAVDSQQHVNVRKTSLWLELQLRPRVAAAAAAGLVAAAAAVARRSRPR